MQKQANRYSHDPNTECVGRRARQRWDEFMDLLLESVNFYSFLDLELIVNSCSRCLRFVECIQSDAIFALTWIRMHKLTSWVPITHICEKIYAYSAVYQLHTSPVKSRHPLFMCKRISFYKTWSENHDTIINITILIYITLIYIIN